MALYGALLALMFTTLNNVAFVQGIKKVYYPPYGTFSNKPPWSRYGCGIVNLLPVPPEKINAQFLLYTCEQNHTLIIDEPDSIKESPLKEDRNLYFIIHGWLSSAYKDWVKEMKNELLDREDCNVVLVDWQRGAGINYFQSAANTRLVGAMTAKLASQLIKYGNISPEKIHVIGHSLGAHTAGYVGYNLRKRFGFSLGRITGLDPASFCFTKTPSLMRLDSTDAVFVSVIHTDCKKLSATGIAEPVGHIDFYPNGGTDQPAMDEESKSIDYDHRQSYRFFTQSINTKCPFWAVPCKSWEEFQKGNCFDCVDSKCLNFGFDVQPRSSVSKELFYLVTDADSNSCQETYRIKILLTEVDYKDEVKEGQFVITIIGTEGRTKPLLFGKNNYDHYQPYATGILHTAVLSGKTVGKLKSAKLSWIGKNSDEDSSVVVEYVEIDTLQSVDSITVCLDPNRALNHRDVELLTVQRCEEDGN